MGFDYDYKTYADSSGKLDLKEGNTCLKFFGYEYQQGKDESSHDYYDGYKATWSSDNSISIQKNRKSYTSKYYWATYTRKYSPSQDEHDLEDRFYKLLEKERFGGGREEVQKTPYLCTSAEEHYGRARAAVAKRLTKILEVLLYLSVIMCYIGLCILSGAPVQMFFIGIIPLVIDLLVLIFPVYIVFYCIVYFVMCLLMPPCFLMSKSKKKKIREKYLNSLTVEGVPEANEILRKYAVLRGYDKI